MLSVPGYEITEEIEVGVSTAIYRGIRERDRLSVILKVLKSDCPTLEEITRLRQEFKITQIIESEGIVKTYSLDKYHNGLALILEDFGGRSLKQVISTRPLSMKEFLQIGIALVKTLGQLHEIPIIHKDIKPSNIIINTETGQVKLTDFSIASHLSLETPTISHPNLLEGTLAYMSPEQTGRMNRSLDYRSDFYSLGATFYEMLTGSLPFTTTDPMELVHSHIAKQTVPPGLLNLEIPEVVSSIAMKLLAKNAEDRYQSDSGLKFDLEACLFQLQTTGKIENFTLGQRDRGNQLSIPQKLYGRQAEVDIILHAFERVGAGLVNNLSDSTRSQQNPPLQGRNEMMLVSGYSGIGKTSVINEIHKPIAGTKGYFISGKFDQFKRNIPYAALIQALQELIRQILTESSEKIAIWQEKLLNVLGQNGQIIIDVVPEVEAIVGKQPELPQLGATESQNRFNRVFQQFINVFCQPDYPLVIFLDDLQWADLASLKLIELLITSDGQCLLIIGAYRDNEVSPTHPLIQTIEKLQKCGAAVNNINLQPLSREHVNQIVTDTLYEGSVLTRSSAVSNLSPALIKENNRVAKLAELLFNKTQGNPFFLTQLLKTLYAEKLLVYNANTSIWQWDIEQIQTVGITDYNVVELIARNIQKLAPNAQQVLKLAACIGDRFSLDILATVNEKSQTATAVDLWYALQAGLILPLSNAYKMPLVGEWGMKNGKWVLNNHQSPISNFQSPISYKFLHDRVQQAAYSLIPESERKATHLKIGQLLLKKDNLEEQKENIFVLVNQLNFGIDLINTQLEKKELAALNLIAGQKAKAATAYEAAVNYLSVGLELLTADSWESNYDLMLNLHVEAVEAQYLSANFEQATSLVEIACQKTANLLDRVKLHQSQIQIYMAQAEMQLALNTGIEVLKMLEVSLEQEPPKKLIIENLINLPNMTDPYKLAAMELLRSIMAPAYIANPALFPRVVFTMVNLCIEYGNSSLAAYGYSVYGVLLCGFLEDIDSGYLYGKLALKLLDKFDAKKLKSELLNLFNSHVRAWKEPVGETIEPLQEAIQVGIEAGNIENASFSILNYCNHLIFMGEHLESVQHKWGQYIELMTKLKLEYSVYSGKTRHQMVLNLLGKSEKTGQLIGTAFNESEMLPVFKDSNNFISLFVVYLSKTILLYLFQNYAEAIENAKLAEPYAVAVSSLLLSVERNFYYSLALLAHYHQVEECQQSEYLSQVVSHQEQMQKWADNAPSNFLHKYELVEAEKARVLGELDSAINLYDRAIVGAKNSGYIHEEALANELAAQFHLGRGSERIAQFYFAEAYYAYIAWGATAKVKHLEERYPQFMAKINAQKPTGLEVEVTTKTTTGGDARVLDLATVMKASLALSGEMILSQLLNKLMKIAIENAGAQKGFLILSQNGDLTIEACGSVESNDVTVSVCPSVKIAEVVPMTIINYVQRTQESVVLNDVKSEGVFTADRYISKNKPKSVLCTPIINQGKPIGLLYLENNLTQGAFTLKRLEVLKILSSQAAISLENARLYTNLEAAHKQLEEYNQTLEEKVSERTLELKEKNECLHQTIQQLQQTQTQLIQAEKMSSLGQLVAGVAHEVNNPINFIYGNLIHANEYTRQLLNLIGIYQQTYPDPTAEIEAEIEYIELDFLKKDLPKMLESMRVGADRIRQIVLSLRNFSRLDESEKKSVDLHSGIDSTLLILQHRLKDISHGQDSRSARGIQVIKEYGQLPLVECYPGHLNQVFMNILANAIDALEEGHKAWSIGHENNNSSLMPDAQCPSPTIWIRTEVINSKCVIIRILDNGCGMTEEVRRRLFDPFFTTKPVGSGTGLGLSISYQIVVEKHGGKLKCISNPGEGTEFIIEIPLSHAKSAVRLLTANTISA